MLNKFYNESHKTDISCPLNLFAYLFEKVENMIIKMN